MTHKEIIKFLLDKKVAILSGAGISLASGLPTVSVFYDHFLPIFYDSDDRSNLKSQIEKTPFERMMEHILSYTENDYSVLNIFAHGKPNTLHRILAQMLVNGWATELYTTNFDCLLEQALEDNGLTKKDYGFYFDEKGFAKLAKSSLAKNVIKIHGTVEKKESIRTTLETITSTAMLGKRKPPVERLFSTGPHEVVVVLGYSFSDIFDINEFIRKIAINKTTIILNHTPHRIEDNDVQILANEKNFYSGRNNPFFGKRTAGYIVNMDTLSFMSELCVDYAPAVHDEECEGGKKYEWGKDLEKWASKFDDVHKSYIAGGICNAMNEFCMANKYNSRAFNDALEYKAADTDKIGLYISIVNSYTLSRFRTRKKQSDCDVLVQWCNEALNLLEDNRNSFSNEFYLKQLSDLTFRLGRIYEDGYLDLRTSKEQYLSALRIESEIGDRLEMSKILHQIGSVDSSLGNLDSAIRYFKESIRLKKKCGYVGGITRTYYTMAAAMLENHKHREAEKYLSKAKDSVSDTGETELTYYIANLQSSIYMKRQEWLKAEEILENNATLLEGIPGLVIPFTTANYQLSRCQIRLKKHERAIELLDKNIKIVSDLGHMQRVFNNRQELALAYLLSGNNVKCHECLSSVIPHLSGVDIIAKGYFCFYVALYYKLFNAIDFYKSFLDASKRCFQEKGMVKEFHTLKKFFDKEIIPDKTLVLDTEKYLLFEQVI